jgi:hypothetical protein
MLDDKFHNDTCKRYGDIGKAIIQTNAPEHRCRVCRTKLSNYSKSKYIRPPYYRYFDKHYYVLCSEACSEIFEINFVLYE